MSRSKDGYLCDFALPEHGWPFMKEMLEKDPGLDTI
jgi:hypothetical protein